MKHRDVLFRFTEHVVAESIGKEAFARSSTINLIGGEMAATISADLDSYQRPHDTPSVRKTVSISIWMANGAEQRIAGGRRQRMLALIQVDC